MDTGIIIIEIFFLYLLASWVILLFFYIFKRPDLTIRKISFRFTSYFILITVSSYTILDAYEFGYFDLAEFIGSILLNLFWLLIPTLWVVIAIVRKIKYGKIRNIEIPLINEDGKNTSNTNYLTDRIINSSINQSTKTLQWVFRVMGIIGIILGISILLIVTTGQSNFRTDLQNMEATSSAIATEQNSLPKKDFLEISHPAPLNKLIAIIEMSNNVESLILEMNAGIKCNEIFINVPKIDENLNSESEKIANIFLNFPGYDGVSVTSIKEIVMDFPIFLFPYQVEFENKEYDDPIFNPVAYVIVNANNDRIYYVDEKCWFE